MTMSTETVAMRMGADAKLAKCIEEMCVEFKIESTMEKAHFIGQMFVESQGFTRFTENLNYSAKRLAEVWPGRYATAMTASLPTKQRQPNEKAKAIGGNPRLIANETYNGRMGNRVGTDDGWNFRGRAAKMITGHDNYLAYSMWAYGDDRVVRNPDMLLDYPDIVRSGAWYWVRGNLGVLARANDVRGVTKGINGGYNGLGERIEATERALAEFDRLRAS